MEDLAYGFETMNYDENTTNVKTAPNRSRESQTESQDIISRDGLQVYLQQVRRYKLLTREEELELAQRVQENNDEEAVNQLVTSNLRLVAKIAKDFSRYWAKNILDLIQEGNLGLIQAARKFDPNRGIKFSYYASFWIKAYMLKFIMENWKIVKIGTTQSQRKLFFNLAREKNRLQALGFTPETKLVAKRLDVKEEEVIEMTQRLESGELSLSTPMGEDSRETYEAFLEDPTLPIDEWLSEKQRRVIFAEKLKEFRKRLSKREADIFDNRIIAEDPLILQEIGDKYNISRERVRQIQERIIKNIRRWSQEEIPNFKEDYNDTENLGAEMLHFRNN
ncbi:MAG: RNA polymerase factor sigma-32 [Desulfobacteraceae bacterium]|jgi:RNA polymerase sigma-32 factor